MPRLEPFRGLRYDRTHVPRLDPVICPPYDVITATAQERLLARDPHNAVRLELPRDPDDGTDGRERYGAAATALARWRADGILRQDTGPTVYIHAMRYAGADGEPHGARGAIVRLRLDTLGPQAMVLPHERTMEGPKEDRFRLLSATGADLSPVVVIHDRPGTAAMLDRLTAGPPVSGAADDGGVTHRLWAVPVAGAADVVTALLDAMGSGPLVIADGHHRYETALRYREECAEARAAAGLPPADTVMALVYSKEEAPSVIATHRVVNGVPTDLVARAARTFHVEPVADAASLVRLMSQPPQSGDRPRFGVWMRGGGAILRAHAEPSSLDVQVLAEALSEIAGIGEEESRDGGRIRYTKDPLEAVEMVESAQRDAAFLLDPTPLEDVLRIAVAGGILPQKSTYFHPKAPTGLVFDPLDR